MNSIRSNKQLVSKCQRCNSTQSILWSKCPNCFYEQMHSQSSISKRNNQDQTLPNIKYQSENEQNEDDLYEDMKEFDQIHGQNISDCMQQSKNYTSTLQRKGKSSQRIVQNNVKVDNAKNENNYKLDGSLIKYIIMFILLIIFLGFLLWDLNGIIKSQVSENIHEVSECSINFQVNDCEEVLNNSLKAIEIKQYCMKQKNCMEKDPYKEIKILKIIFQYFIEITHESLNNMNSKITGIVFLIYLSGLTFFYFLSCICPRR